MADETIKNEPEKPSYVSSTFSILTIIVVTGFTCLCIYSKDINSLKDVTLMLLSGYCVKKGVEMKQKQNGP